jgi:hypothetical protein
VRASGHTFEYLGYGPGNYSTGLPQVQSITLTEREEFLVQSQERSGGIVVYTGMNNNGDSFIGNRKTSSSTGEEVTFDNPIPTVTGEDPSRLSAVFDEVTVKERLVVEGGNSGTVLSQFDGPVTFNKEVKFTDNINAKSQLKITNQQDSTTTANGALVVSGGVGIAKNLNVGGTTTLTGLLSANGSASVTGTLGVSGATTLSNTLGVSGATTLSNTLGVSGATTLSNTLGVSGATTLAGLLNANGGIAVDTNRFTVADATGNTAIAGTLEVTGATTLSSTLGVSGLLNANGGIAVDTNRFTVADVTGNTAIAGTLEVTGATTLSTLAVTGNSTFTGRIIPSVGNATNNGIEWTSDPGGGSGDRAFIKYYVESGENTRLHIGIQNDADDDLYLEASTTTMSGALNVTGDITAFASDERLKTNIEPLENALDKVLALNGFTYNFNEIGQSLGFDGSVRYVGVSAQEVQKVLPEAIKPAPADENYITVQYEKLVPLLIEAIKELKEEINELKGK